MDRSYWHKQTTEQPLFPELLWSQPQNSQLAGKLLIVGGNVHGFAAVAEAYNQSLKAGVGAARVLLPDALRKTVGPILEAGEFAPSTPSGSFAQKALAELLSLSDWADGVLLAGEFGRNSETAIMLETFLEKYTGQVTLTKDAVDYFVKTPEKLLDRADTTLVISMAQLQQLARASRFVPAFTFDFDLLRLVSALHEFSLQFPANIVVKHLTQICVAVNGQVSSTALTHDREVWRVQTAARAAVWWLQLPGKRFEALTTTLTL